METEILSEEELADLTGYKHRGYQRQWLKAKGSKLGLYRKSRWPPSRWPDVCPHEARNNFANTGNPAPTTSAYLDP